jgi:uncharacterized protein
MLIPHTALAAETLHNLVEEFVTREGTEYGYYSHNLADKVKQVLRQLEQGKAVIFFDPESSTSHIEIKDRILFNHGQFPGEQD